MKLTELLEKDKDRLLTELAGAKTPEKSVKVLENELDKLLLRHNEQSSVESERDAAAYMLQAVRLSLPLIDSAGKTRVWESGTKEAPERKLSLPFLLLAAAGAGLSIYGLIPLMVTAMSVTGSGSSNDVLTRAILIIVGIAAVFFAGIMLRRPARGKRGDLQVEISADPAKLYRHFRTAILSVDQSLEEVSAKERWSKREQAGNIEGRKATTPEIDLFSDLLAASYSGDPEYALEKIDSIKYYLHRQQIDVVDFSDDTRMYFDLMPGTQAGTIRPALVADGALLKKGLASTGK